MFFNSRVPGDKLDDPRAGLDAPLRTADDTRQRARHLRQLKRTTNITAMREKSKEWSGNVLHHKSYNEFCNVIHLHQFILKFLALTTSALAVASTAFILQLAPIGCIACKRAWVKILLF